MVPHLHAIMATLMLAALAGGAAWAWREPARYRLRHLTALAALAFPVAFLGGYLVLDALLTAVSPVPPTGALVLVALIVALFAGLVFLARVVPWQGPYWTLLVAPLVVAGLVALVQVVAGVPGATWWERAGTVAALPLAAMTPFAASTATPRPGRGGAASALAASTALALLLVLALPFLFVGLVQHPPAHAAHAWEVRVTPDDPTIPYAVRVPFVFEDADGAVTDAVDALRDQVRVTEGDADIGWVDDGRYLEIQGVGPVVVASTFTFFGSEADRHGYPPGLADDEVWLLSPAPVEAQVDWQLRMDARGSTACDLDVALAATVRTGGAARLDPDGNGFTTVCP